jgi:hypothetical protein
VEDHSEGQFVCECSDPGCVEKVFLRPTEYADVRAHPTRFFLVGGHEALEVDRIIEARDGFTVVEKPVVP